MTEEPAPRAPHAPHATQTPAPARGEGPGPGRPPQGHTAPRIVVHESDACQGNITGWDCEDCEDDACEHECHDTEPTSDLRERLDAALRTVGLARNLAAYRDAVLPVVEEALAEQKRALAAQIGLYKSAENDVTDLTQRAEEAEQRAERALKYLDDTHVNFMVGDIEDDLRAILTQSKETR